MKYAINATKDVKYRVKRTVQVDGDARIIRVIIAINNAKMFTILDTTKTRSTKNTLISKSANGVQIETR